MPRGRTAIPITQPTNHRKKAPGAEHAKDNTRTEQGDRSQSLRYSLQQTRLRGSRTLLVAEVHPAQRAHRARTRRTVRSDPNNGLIPLKLLRIYETIGDTRWIQ
jgi:hypothetical protein